MAVLYNAYKEKAASHFNLLVSLGVLANVTSAALHEVCKLTNDKFVACTASHSACIEDVSGTWRCRCISNFYRNQSQCAQIPTRLFTKSKQTFFIETDAPSGSLVGELLFASDVAPLVAISTVNLELDPYDKPLNLQRDNFLSGVTLNTTAGISKYFTAVVSMSLEYDGNTVSDLVFIIINIKESNILQELNIIIYDNTPALSVVSHVSLTNIYLSSLLDYKITLSGTASKILTVDNNGLITCSETIDVDALSGDTSTGTFVSWYLSGNIKVVSLDGSEETEIASIKVNVLLPKVQVFLSIAENTSRKAVIARFGSNDKWTILSEDMVAEVFALTSFNLSIRKTVDADNDQSKFEFKLDFKYGASVAEVMMTVTFFDVNDVLPVFDRPEHYVTIIQGTLPGSVVAYIGATDADSDVLSYSIDDPLANQLFSVNDGLLRATKIVTTTTYAAVTNSSFTVTVNDTELYALESAKIFINVFSLDNAQILDNVFAGDISENVPAGHLVTSAFIANYTDFKMIGAGISMFRINSTSGDITSIKAIDREDLVSDILELTVTAVLDDEGKSCSLTVLGTAPLTVLDENDNPPVFYYLQGQSSYTGSVVENSPPGTTVLTDKIFATDLDSGVNAEITYSGNPAYANIFSVNPQTAEITVMNGTLDRETTNSYELLIYATDGNASLAVRNTGTATIHISIEDENDNSPEFQNSPYSANVTENTETTFAALVNATDIDAGSNGQVTYSILDGGLGYFDINSKSGDIVVSKLDYEEKSRYNLVILAADRGDPARSSITNLVVTVLDENDNAPVFAESFIFQIQETPDCSQALNAIITVTDKDDGLNAEIKFSSGSSDFSINITTGQLSCINPLDYDSPPKEYTFLVTAKDSGVPTRSSSANITVLLTDINDNSPSFYPSSIFSIDIRKTDLTLAKPVVVINSRDTDWEDNSKVNIEFIEGNATGYFTVNSENGVVRVNNSNARTGLYFVSLLAYDHGNPPLNSTGELYINILQDVNTTFSFRELDFYFTAQEETNITESLGQLTVNNPYIEDLTFELILTDYSVNFTVNQTGFVFCHSELDREVVDAYKLVARVFITNNQIRGDIALVHITVLDINDNPPVFSALDERIRSVSENIPLNSLIYSVDVTDLDTGQNAQITYTSLMTSPFAIDETTGRISVTSELDREKQNGHNYTFFITATDGGVSPNNATAKVVILVLDVNDNTPEFDKKEYTVIVSEDTSIGTFVLMISATDADQNDINRKLSYNVLTDAVSCPFSISDEVSLGQISGQLKVLGSLDREKRDVHTCVITATDGGDIPKTGTATVIVNVGDVNDNAPRITNYPSTIHIQRDAIIGYVLTTNLTVEDLDIGQNAEFQFNISASSGHSLNTYLLIDVHTGKITLNRNLADLQADITLLVIDVKDKGIPPLSSNIQIILNITDANARPYFPSNYIWNITEETVTDSVLQVTALDIVKKEKVVCDCTYALNSGEEYFKINQSNGVVTQVRMLDREEFENGIFTFTIHATDKDPVLPKQTDEAKPAIVTVHLEDVNDNPPIFQQLYTFTTTQTAVIGSSVGIAAAEDKDYNAISSYSIVSQSVPNAFSVNSSTGEFYVNGDLTRDISQMYEVQVVLLVQDLLKSSYLGRTVVRIQVSYDDKNTHAPKFSQNIYSVTLSDDEKSGKKVDIPDYRATDEDTGKEGQIEYSFIEETNYRDTFRIDSVTGYIYLRFDLNTIDVGIVNLTVIAKDKADIPKSGSTLVIVTIDGGLGVCGNLNAELRITDEQRQTYFIAFIALLVLSVLAIIAALALLYKFLSTRSSLKLWMAGDRNSSNGKTSSQHFRPAAGYSNPYAANAMHMNLGIPAFGGNILPKEEGYSPMHGRDRSSPMPYRDINFRLAEYLEPVPDYGDDAGDAYIHPSGGERPDLPPRSPDENIQREGTTNRRRHAILEDRMLL